MIGTNHLTGETSAQWITHPGQAHFAIPGATAKCGDCWYWAPRQPSDRRAVCNKAWELLRGQRPRAIPNTATACQYFTQEKPAAVDG
jgi:hypothetical protein